MTPDEIYLQTIKLSDKEFLGLMERLYYTHTLQSEHRESLAEAMKVIKKWLKKETK